MASDTSLEEFANRPKRMPAWADSLPDDVYNQLWDAMRSNSVGKEMACQWLKSLGYEDATPGMVRGVMNRERR